jgi:predicted phage tail protein
MIRVVAIKNPFDPLASREIREFEPGKTIRELVDDYYPEGSGNYTVEISVNGTRIDDPCKYDLVPLGDASVVFCAVPAGGDGKNPLAIVAMLALIVVTAGAATPLAGAMGIGGAMGTALVSTGMMVAGGLAIQALFPMSQPDVQGSGDINNSPTYSWDPGGNMLVEGGTLPEVLGVCRVTPPVISKYIRSVGDKQYLNVLYALAGHRITDIRDVRMNGTSVDDINGVNVIVERDCRLGDATQVVLPNFDDVRSDISVGVKLTETDTWTTRTTDGTSVEKLLVTFSFPKGIYYLNDNGGMENQTIKIAVEYSPHGADSWTRLTSYNTEELTIATPRWSGGYWTQPGEGTLPEWIEMESGSTTYSDRTEGEAYKSGKWIYESDTAYSYPVLYYWHWLPENTEIKAIGTVAVYYFSVTRGTASPTHISTEYVVFESPGQYDIRCKLVDELPSTARYGNDTYWESFQEVVTDDFTYPGTALLSISALATDHLSGGMPTVDCIVERTYVPVWTGAKYEDKLATLPAWACYHILHRAEYKGTGDASLAASYEVKGVPSDRIDYAAFQSWAAWCVDPYYPIEGGYYHPGSLTVNLYFDQSMSVRKALDIVATNGRGCVVQLGSKFSCIVDRIEQIPVQRFLFTCGNIVKDSFQEEWLPVTDRANAIEVTFFDSELDYSRQTVTVYAQDFDTAGNEINTMQATLYGCTHRSMAIRYGKFLINSNKYVTLTCSFDADVDAIACVPGDVIEVAHDVPQWGYSGRVVSATSNTITFDRPVTIEAATTYNVMVKHQDDDSREEKEVATGAGTYSTISISGTWSKIPAAHALYSFGEVDHVVKGFRVLSISRSQELRRRITCLEYVAEVYEDDATIPDPENVSDLPRVGYLTATEVYRGGSDTLAALSWRGYALYWDVYYRYHMHLPSGYFPWAFVKRVYNPVCDVGPLAYGFPIDFAVTGTNNPNDGEIVQLTLRGKIDPPGDVASVTVTQLNFSLLVEWSEVTDFDLSMYELRFLHVEYDWEDLTDYWQYGTMIFQGKARSCVWEYKESGRYQLQVRAVDAFGNYSTNSALVWVVVSGPSVTNGDYTFSGQNIVLSWELASSGFSIEHYEISHGDTYAAAIQVGTTKGTTFSTVVDYGGSRTYWIVPVDIAGNDGTPAAIHAVVVPPGVVTSATPTVIDNNVLLSWSAPSVGSLPVAYYEVSKGDAYATAEVIGTVNGTFSVVFESASGDYVYWIAAYDTAGNVGTETSIPATVNQPPDYILMQNWTDDWSGTKASALAYGGKLYAPINISETYAGHFSVRTTPQAQIDAGYPLWIQPVPNTATYTRVFDYGTVIDAMTKVTVEAPYAQEYGSASLAATIEVSADGSSYGSPVSGYTTMESGFRYVRVTLIVTGASNTAILSVTRLNVKLDLKQITDAGRVEVTANPTTVNFNKDFIDIVSITVTAEGTTALFAIYDFTDVPNPDHFHAYLFDAAGNNASGAGKYISWTARGV